MNMHNRGRSTGVIMQQEQNYCKMQAASKFKDMINEIM
jgi:hypothetical protein